MEDKRANGIRVMSAYRNIESMLLCDDVLSRLCDSHGKSGCLEAIQDARENALASADGHHAPNDLRPAAQAVHQAVKRELHLAQSGGTKEAFMRDVLAPLVTAGTAEYEKLKGDIFGQ